MSPFFFGLVGRRSSASARGSVVQRLPHGALTRLPPRVQACQPSACRRARQGAANRPFASLRRSTALRSTPCAVPCGTSNAQATVLGVTPCVRPECGERAVPLASCCSGSSCESPMHRTCPLQSQLAKRTVCATACAMPTHPPSAQLPLGPHLCARKHLAASVRPFGGTRARDAP